MITVKQPGRWSIVVADDHGPEVQQPLLGETSAAPIQYCSLGEHSTLLQKALRRARQLAPTEHVLVTAIDEYRGNWQPQLWFVRPENRYLSSGGSATLLTTAAAVLSIAAENPSNVVTILPARCHVTHDWILSAGLDRVMNALPRIPEGVVTLGMMDVDDGVDEDYLLASRTERGMGAVVEGKARRPVPWVAKHLLRHGAMVASGILIGYAGKLAQHIHQYWPRMAPQLEQVVKDAHTAGTEKQVPLSISRQVPRSLLRSLPWSPPTFPMRAFRVYRCGWHGLHTARAVVRLGEGIARSRALQSPTFEVRADANDYPVHSIAERLSASPGP